MRLGTICGVAFRVNVGWLFVFALLTWSPASDVGALRGAALRPEARAAVAVATAAALFVCVLLRELARALAARARGVAVRGVTLFIFGGVPILEREADAESADARLLLVGPLASVALGGLFLLASRLIAARHAAPEGPILGLRGALAAATAFLGGANLAIAAFNLLPAYPLDGGRALRVLLRRATRDARRATLVVCVVSRAVSGAFIAWGILATLGGDARGGPWLTFAGVLLLQAGERERAVARIGDALRGHRARELASPPPVRLAADASAADALQTLLAHHAAAAPVYVGERFLGVVSLQDLVRVSEPGVAYVTSAMTPARDLATIDADVDAAEVTRLLSRRAGAMLPVVDDGGELVGFLTRGDALRWMAERAEARDDGEPPP